MRNYKKYRSTVINLFQLFLEEKIDKEGLINGLESVDSIIKKGRRSSKDIWFKFFKGDTGATTIKNIYNDLSYRTNAEYTRHLLKMSVDNPKELQIYYS